MPKQSWKTIKPLFSITFNENKNTEMFNSKIIDILYNYLSNIVSKTCL